ncbi:MAG TPA: hypothetical protein VLS90_02885 [Thermodesulfobacteriota bacterium]|nr:hypothetical protein [Thermodesulfobacteriota bacterium]
MKEQSLKGLLAIWTDIDKDFIPTFRKWHSEEHMSLRIKTPGWYVGHRYHGLEGAPGFLISYETADPADLAGKSYHDSLNLPDEHTREALSHYRNSVRSIYRLVKAAGEALPTDAPYYLAVRWNADGEDTLRWFGGRHLADACRVPGVRRARGYELDDKISHIMTEERKLYAAGPGKQKYLAVYELTSPEIVRSAAWNEAWAKEEARGMKIDHRDFFEVEFTIYPPKK